MNNGHGARNNPNPLPPPCDIKKGENQPIELEPRWSHGSRRLDSLIEAITRCLKAGLELPIEWIDEYNDLNIKYGHYLRQLN